MKPATYTAFFDELEKIAVSPNLAGRAAATRYYRYLKSKKLPDLKTSRQLNLHRRQAKKQGFTGKHSVDSKNPKTVEYDEGWHSVANVEREKTSGLIQNLGTRIVSNVRAAPGAALAMAKATPGAVQGGIRNAGSAVSAFATPVDSLKRGWQTSVTDFGKMGRGMKALTAFGLVTGGHEALAKEDPLRQGRSRTVRVGTAIGDQVGGLIGSPFGLAGGLVGGQIGRKAGGLVGKGVEVARNLTKKKPQPTPEMTT